MATENRDLKIRITAVLDTNARSVLRPLVSAAKSTREQVQREFDKLGGNLGKSISLGVNKASQSLWGLSKSAKVSSKVTETAIEAMVTKFTKLGTAAANMAALSASVQDAANQIQRLNTQLLANLSANRLLKASGSGPAGLLPPGGGSGGIGGGGGGPGYRSLSFGGRREDWGYRMGYWTMRNLTPVTPMLSMGKRIAGDIIRGAGVDFNVGGLLSKTVADESLSTKISNNAWMPQSEGAAKNRVAGSVIMKEATEAARASRGDRGDILAGIDTFVAQTGDLKTARDIMKDMAVFAKATGAEFTHVAGAAAAIDNELGDIPNKGEAIKQIMLALGGQGKMGAIEFSDLARSLGKMTVKASAFSLSKGSKASLESQGITTEAGQNIAVLGGLAQAARAHGGRATATTAIQSARAFIQDMTGGSLLKRWHESGMNVFADKSHTSVKDPKELILEVFRKTGGAKDKITHLMPNANSRAVLDAYAKVYKEAGGGKAGLEAVSKSYDTFLKQTMTVEEVQKQFAESLETTESKAKEFQNRLQELADDTAGKVLPSLNAMSGGAIKVATAFAELTAWAARNPGEAVVASITGAVTKAGLEQSFRLAIEKAFNGSNSPLAKLGSAFTIASAAVTIAEVGKLYINSAFKEKAREENDEANKNNTVASQGKAKGPKELGSQIDETSKRIYDLENKNADDGLVGLFGALTKIAATVDPDAKDALEAQHRARLNVLNEQKALLQELVGEMKKIQPGYSPTPYKAPPKAPEPLNYGQYANGP